MVRKRISTIAALALLVAIVSSSLAGPVWGEQPQKVKVLIGFKRQPGRAEQALVHAAGGTIKYTYHLVPAIAATLPEPAIAALQANPNVTHVDLDGQVHAVDAELDNAWGVKRIGAGVVHGYNKGTGVKVAIIDSGIDDTHPDLDANCAGGYDFVNSDTDPMDDYGHGTHVAGTVAAEDNDIDTSVVGVAPEADLYALKVLNADGVGYSSDIIAALEWCVDNGMQVANLSLGSSRDPGDTEKAAFDSAYAAGVVIVAAAGNDGNPPGKGDNVIYPARYDSVIAVAATDSDDNRASWSSTGDQVELAAPGVSVFSTWNDSDSPHDPQPVCYDGVCYKYGSGTSMASPHVAGTAALVIASGITDANGDGNVNDEVRQRLIETADDLEPAGRGVKYGFGLVDADEAAAPPGATGSIDGTVTSEEDSSPISGATVIVEGTAKSATTDPTGYYFIADIPVGDYTVTASADGFTSASQGVTVSENGPTTAGFALTPIPSGQVMYVQSIDFSSKTAGPNKFFYTTVKVVDGGGNPLGGVGVEMSLTRDSSSSWNFAGETGADGTVKFTLLKAPSGDYTAEVTDLMLASYEWDKMQGEISASYTLY